jgi:hypothetical protein
MKTSKIAPLALLIPAVVLAQPAPMPPAQAVMPPGTMRSPPFNPVNPVNPVNRAKAADALNNAKKQDQALSPSGQVGTTDSYNNNSRTNFSGFYPSCC